MNWIDVDGPIKLRQHTRTVRASIIELAVLTESLLQECIPTLKKTASREKTFAVQTAKKELTLIESDQSRFTETKADDQEAKSDPGKMPDDLVRRGPSASGGRLIAFLILIYLAIRVFDLGGIHRLPILAGGQPKAQSAVPRIWTGGYTLGGKVPPIYFGGRPVVRAGTDIDLGPAPSTPAEALVTWLFGAKNVVLPSCLTVQPPAAVIGQADSKLPVGGDLPGFYGAPWTGESGGNLIALLHVYAPRSPARPADDTILQIYRHYDGLKTIPDVSTDAPVRIYRGRAAILYRVFASSPVRCIDLVVPVGQPAGTAYLYYRHYERYFEATARFAVQK